MKVYLVLRTGPEWNDVVEVHTDKRLADWRADYLFNHRDMNNIYESLSGYLVQEHTVVRPHKEKRHDHRRALVS